MWTCSDTLHFTLYNLGVKIISLVCFLFVCVWGGGVVVCVCVYIYRYVCVHMRVPACVCVFYPEAEP